MRSNRGKVEFDMSQIDKVPAKCFFADLLLPLSYANARRNVCYLDRTAKSGSYWGPVVSRTGGLEKLTAESSSGPALLELLGQYWVKQNDRNLPKLLPYLVALRSEIVESHPDKANQEPRLSEFVYPIF
jgi:hypothetical protein